MGGLCARLCANSGLAGSRQSLPKCLWCCRYIYTEGEPPIKRLQEMASLLKYR